MFQTFSFELIYQKIVLAKLFFFHSIFLHYYLSNDHGSKWVPFFAFLLECFCHSMSWCALNNDVHQSETLNRMLFLCAMIQSFYFVGILCFLCYGPGNFLKSSTFFVRQNCLKALFVCRKHADLHFICECLLN